MKLFMSLFVTALVLFAAPRVGDNEVAFALPNLYNPSVQTSNTDLRGRVVLLNLWASWCTGCQEEMPLFVKLQKHFSEKSFKIVLVNIDSDPQDGRDFLQSVDPEHSLYALYDGEKTLPKAYRCPGMPSSFLIDQNGKIVDVFIGSLNEDGIENLEKELNKLLGE